MLQRHALPRLWLMTDERIADVLGAIARLPRGSGIVFRHYATPPTERRALFDRVRSIARRNGHILLLADTPVRAFQWQADGCHQRSLRASRGLRTMAVHDRAEWALARRIKADLIFISPVFPTRSHANARLLVVTRLGLLAATLRHRTVALGGMNTRRWRQLTGLKLYGWAAIDGLSR